jgi:hypothetical protein
VTVTQASPTAALVVGTVHGIDPENWEFMKLTIANATRCKGTTRGRLSGMAPLSWAKSAVLEAATRELEYEARHRPAIDPPKPQQIAPAFESGPPPVSYSVAIGSSLPSSILPGLLRQD